MDSTHNYDGHGYHSRTISELSDDVPVAYAAPIEQASTEQSPAHPIPSMQAAFEESIWESMEDPPAEDEHKDVRGAQERRQQVLDNEDHNDSYNAKWRSKPQSKFHPLFKLVAQISFGVHLLQQGLAKSNDEVVKIMTIHVGELDEFLERTMEDFNLALEDIEERINHLKLPLEHVNIFDIMLDDRQFRTSIVEGNLKIEKVIARTAQAMNDSLVDVNKGMEATSEFRKYLASTGSKWAERDRTLLNIYNAMLANVGGWISYLQELQLKGNSLGVALVQLGSIVNEMSKRAGVASRRSIAASRSPASRSPASSRPSSRRSSQLNASTRIPRRSNSNLNKPLPSDPDPVAPAVDITLPRQRSTPKDSPMQQIRTAPHSPAVREKRSDPDVKHRRRRSATADLADFFKTTGPPGSKPSSSAGHPNPLKSNPSVTKPKSVDILTASPTVLPPQPSYIERPTSRDRKTDSAYSSGSSARSSDERQKDPLPKPSPLKQSTHATGRLSPFPSSRPTTSGASSMLVKSKTTSSLPLNAMTAQEDAPLAKAKRKSSISTLKTLFQRKFTTPRPGSSMGTLREVKEVS